MIIGLIGPPRAGKSSVAGILVSDLGFKQVADFKGLGALGGLKHCWQTDVRVVVRRVTTEEAEILTKRPFCMLVAVDAPLGHRIDRQGGTLDISCTVEAEDNFRFGQNGFVAWARAASVRLINAGTLEDLRKTVLSLDLENPQHLRPSWDTYFLEMGELLSQRTNCARKKEAAIIVKDTRVVSTGYGGTPRGMQNCIDGGCDNCAKEKADDPLDLCICICAEESALIEAGRARCVGASIYVTKFPCVACAKKIRQAGITKVIYQYGRELDEAALMFLKGAGVGVQQHTFRSSWRNLLYMPPTTQAG